ncbi:tripartite motif-containing protein 3-like [Dreissena polymorpha]|uniref:RING-type domain-containing protein n=1 Tax=Dreissena polymorpha TaxID=45954 RepID=A0A9D4FG41_DREPO|nr:tripartite motif-containing protein 3-like [Dreissena polymorpha]KAH3797296.1 hypothetical protein DPMN_150874 [Dreissena polymorpha]
MATRLVNNLKDEYLRCRICLEQYELPKSLPCDHIFCQTCLTEHVTQTAVRQKGHVVVTCPLCRHQTTVKSRDNFEAESWVKSLPTDTLIDSLQRTIHLHASSNDKLSAERLPKLCQIHGGKPREAYCFTHAQLVCWECAARDHRACEVDSAEKAIEVVRPQIDSLKTTVSEQLAKAREMGKIDQKFTDSKNKTLREILDMETRLEQMYESAKQQFALARADVEECMRLHLDDRKSFYDVVSNLLEQNCTLEILGTESDTAHVLSAIENSRADVLKAISDLSRLEKNSASGDKDFVCFVRDEQMNAFLNMYSSIGFVDTNVSGSAHAIPEMKTPRDAPSSISHILKRPPSKNKPAPGKVKATARAQTQKKST